MQSSHWVRLKGLTEERIAELQDCIDKGRMPKKFEWWFHKTLQSNIAWNRYAIAQIEIEQKEASKVKENRLEMKLKTFRGNDE